MMKVNTKLVNKICDIALSHLPLGLKN
jgi:hypothetical protein